MTHHTCQISGLDEIFKEYFGNDKGFFCEIGAYDGLTYSNTWGLANQGWEGIYVEPDIELVKKCRINHAETKVRIMSVACSNYDGEIIIYKGQDINSANSEMVKGEPFTVECLTLDNILDGVQQLDLLVIDVEFHEKEVLQGFTLDKWKPKMVIIEAHEKHENEAMRLNVDFINDYFSTYKKIYSDSINNIYVR